MKGDTWNEALKRADHFDGMDVIYCMSFGHGLMKVGRTSSMPDRIRQYDLHGLLSQLMNWMVVVPVSVNQIVAERHAIHLFESRFKRTAKEVFIGAPDIGTAKKVLQYCASASTCHKKVVQKSGIRLVVQKMGGLSAIAKRYGYTAGQIGNWLRRGIPAHVIADDQRLARALKRAGYERTGK